MAEKEEGDIESPASETSPVSWQPTDDESISEAKENAAPYGIARGSKPPPTKEAACRTEKRVWGCLRRRYAIAIALGAAAAAAATVIALVLCLVVLPSRADRVRIYLLSLLTPSSLYLVISHPSGIQTSDPIIKSRCDSKWLSQFCVCPPLRSS